MCYVCLCFAFVLQDILADLVYMLIRDVLLLFLQYLQPNAVVKPLLRYNRFVPFSPIVLYKFCRNCLFCRESVSTVFTSLNLAIVNHYRASLSALPSVRTSSIGPLYLRLSVTEWLLVRKSGSPGESNPGPLDLCSGTVSTRATYLIFNPLTSRIMFSVISQYWV
jgi:hypothetical protein